MKTKKQIMDAYAVSKGYDSWNELVNRLTNFTYVLNICINQVMEIYAMECLKLASENAYTKDVKYSNYVEVDKESITNENNIIK